MLHRNNFFGYKMKQLKDRPTSKSYINFLKVSLNKRTSRPMILLCGLSRKHKEIGL